MVERSVAYHTHMQTPRAATNMYLTPSIFSSSSRLQAYLGGTSLALEGDKGTPTQNMPESRHERKRLDTEQGNSVVLPPPTAARKAHFPDEGDIDDSAGNRTGIPLAQITRDLPQPHIG